MPECYFAVLDIVQIRLADGYKIVITTDIPCHLWMRWSTTPPQYHTIPSYLRGVYMHGDRYICFVAYIDNEQEEAGDTLTHTFIKTAWPACQTRWFYFWGKVAGQVCKSTSAVFEKHFPAPPTRIYYPCWHNRDIFSRHGTWSIARNGNLLQKAGSYQRPLSKMPVVTLLVATYQIYRAYLNFDTTAYPTHLYPVGARLGLYITAIGGIVGNLVLTKGLWREPVELTDFLLQTNETENLGQIAQTDLVLNQYNWLNLNSAGLAWLNHNYQEHRQHESYDWRGTQFFDIFNPNWFSQSFTPQTNHVLTRMKVKVRRKGNPPGLWCYIYLAGPGGCPTGIAIASRYTDPGNISPDPQGAWYAFNFPAGVTLTAGTKYCVVLLTTGGNAANCFQWRGSSANQYPNGVACFTTNAGISWTPYASEALYFIEYEEQLVGQTNFCLRTSFDVDNVPPTPLQAQFAHLHSAQKGYDYYPILEVTF